VLAVRWYLRYGLSYRDVEELLAERGIIVDHVTIYRWVQRFTPLLIDVARPCRHAAGDRWFVDETYVKVAGRWVYLYRAIDQYGLWGSRTRSRALSWGYAACSYSLIRPPRTGRRLICSSLRSEMGWSGRGGRSWRPRWGRRPL
jgi:hypothetical protein